MQGLFGKVFHSIHVSCFDPLAFTTVVNIETRERGDEGNENEPIAGREFWPLLKERRWNSRVLEDSLNPSKAWLGCQGRLWIRLGHGRKNPRQPRCLPKMKQIHKYRLHICLIYRCLNADTETWSVNLMREGHDKSGGPYKIREVSCHYAATAATTLVVYPRVFYYSVHCTPEVWPPT